jgi:hypothetical protein
VHYKDVILDQLANRANVAQFISFDSKPAQRFSRVFGHGANHVFESVEDAAGALLRNSAEHSVNVRSYDPASPKSREFVYGLKNAADAAANVRRLASQGLFTILNETIDIHDGGVSGVALGNLLEFAPDDTPRAVEKPGTASFPRTVGLRFLEAVYGFRPKLDFSPSTRVEFSLHPIRRGVRADHTIIWELEDVDSPEMDPEIRWPNRFSQIVGDKAYGLLVASLFGLSVPRTLVISRAIAPFFFGEETGASETWIRTSPRVQVPGRFTTRRGWVDPFQLMQAEDPSAAHLASILAQREVSAQYAGAAIANQAGTLTIEGTHGFGDEFMLGRASLAPQPDEVHNAVKRAYAQASAALGPVRMEWVYDGQTLWVVQFHRGASVSSGSVIVPGVPESEVEFEVADGLEALRDLLKALKAPRDGVVLIGDVGITSHFGDLLRKAGIPSRIERKTPVPTA